MGDIKAGDWLEVECGDKVYRCERIDSSGQVSVTIRPIKPKRRIKPSELLAWLKTQEGWVIEAYRGTCDKDGNADFIAGVGAVGSVETATSVESGPTLPKAILALRKQLRKKGVVIP